VLGRPLPLPPPTPSRGMPTVPAPRDAVDPLPPDA
jgi:hypothetical protein